MTSYTGTFETTYRGRDVKSLCIVLVDELADQGAAAALSPRGYAEVTITYPARDLTEAMKIGVALVESALRHAGQADEGVLAAQVTTTAEHDARLGFEIHGDDDLLSVQEVADELGVTPQRVRQRLDAGELGGRRIGKLWAIPRAEVHRIKQAAIPTAKRPSYRTDA